MLFAIACFISPLVGTWMYKEIGMALTCDIIAAVNLGVGVLCFVFNLGFFPFSEDRQFKKKLEALQERAQLLETDKVEETKDKDTEITE